MNRLGKATTLLMTFTMLFTSGCSKATVKETSKQHDTDDVLSREINSEDMDMGYLKFVFDLYGRCAEEDNENLMVSPTSVMLALDLAAAGANGDTLSQIMALYGAENDPEGHFRYSAEMMERINASEGVDFNVANAIWLNETWLSNSVSPDYIDFVNDVFGAEAAYEVFGPETINHVNVWVDDQTDGMIKELIKELNPETVAVLVNAIAFDGGWATAYEDYQVHDMEFTGLNGTYDVSMLNGAEDWYLENDIATGFMKYYEGEEYAFIAMLPKDDSISANEFATSMTAEDYIEFWESKTDEYNVYARLPEFTSEYEVEMNDILKDLGVEDAFDGGNADFTGIADIDANIFISKVIHKTYVDVNQEGTRAAAATAVVMEKNDVAAIDETEVKEVFLDRPFAYAIVEVETGNPIFIGTVNDVEVN